MVRLTVLPLAAMILFVILHGALGLGRDTTPRIHSLRNPGACLECHDRVEDGSLRGAEPQLCTRCHAWEELGPACGHDGDAQGETLARCSSCHDPHGKVRGPSLLHLHARGP